MMYLNYDPQEIKCDPRVTADRFKNVPIHNRPFTNASSAVSLVTLVLIWLCLFFFTQHLSESANIGHPTDSLGRICGSGVMTEKPYLYVFSFHACKKDDPISCVLKSICVSECPKESRCSLDERKLFAKNNFCFTDYIEYHEDYCPEYLTKSAPNDFDICRPANDINPCRGSNLSEIISHYIAYNHWYFKNNHLVLTSSKFQELKNQILSMLAYLVISAIFSLFSFTHPYCCICVLLFLIFINVFLLTKMSTINQFYHGGRPTYLNIWKIAVLLYCSFKLVHLLTRFKFQRNNVYNMFLAIRRVFTNTKSNLILVFIAGLLYALVVCLAFKTTSYIMLIYRKVYMTVGGTNQHTSVYALEECDPSKINCYFRRYELRTIAWAFIITHLLIFSTVGKTIELLLYYIVSMIVSSWYFTWKESQEGMSHTMVIAGERAILRNLGTIFKMAIQHTFYHGKYVLKILKNYVTKEQFGVGLQTWILTETVLFGTKLPDAKFEAYHKRIRNLDKVMNLNYFICAHNGILNYILPLSALNILQKFFDSDLNYWVVYICFFIGFYVMSNITNIWSQTYVDTIYACVLYEVDESNDIDFDGTSKPDIAWPFLFV